MYIYSIWALNHGHYPYKWLWTYAGDKFFEAEGEIKFSPVYAHDLLLLECSHAQSRSVAEWARRGPASRRQLVLRGLATALRVGRRYAGLIPEIKTEPA